MQALDSETRFEAARFVVACGFGGCLLRLRTEAGHAEATAGDTHLGGEDFDNRIVDFCMQDFKQFVRRAVAVACNSL